jgi:hypothetical protein
MAALDRRLRRGERTLSTLDEIKSRLCDLASVFASARKRAADGEPKAAPETPPTSA